MKRTLHKKTIHVAQNIAPILSSRDVIQSLRTAITRAKDGLIHLDFTDVEFVSRSAAHAIVMLKENVAPKHTIIFVHTNDAVKSMLRTVAANRIVPAHKSPEFHAKRIDFSSLLREKSLASL